jgi:hypothetical protein
MSRQMLHTTLIRKLVAFTAMCLLIACFAVPKPISFGATGLDGITSITTTDYTRIRGAIDIKYYSPMLNVDQAKLERNIVLTIQQWEKDSSRQITHITVQVMPVEYFMNSEGLHIVGVYYNKIKLIQVIKGDYCEVPWLYHELCHYWYPGDNIHNNPLWPMWDERSQAIAKRLRVVY